MKVPSNHIQFILLVPIKGFKSRSALHSPSTAPPGTSRAARHTAVAQIWWQLSRGVATRHPNSSPNLAMERNQTSSVSNMEKLSPHLKVWRSTIGSDGEHWFEWCKREKPFQPFRSVGETISVGFSRLGISFHSEIFSQVFVKRWMVHMCKRNEPLNTLFLG